MRFNRIIMRTCLNCIGVATAGAAALALVSAQPLDNLVAVLRQDVKDLCGRDLRECKQYTSGTQCGEKGASVSDGRQKQQRSTMSDFVGWA